METTGFTEEQLTVRDAIFKICADFPDDYWMERDQTSEYPHELHSALSKDGWIGIAWPVSLDLFVCFGYDVFSTHDSLFS